MLLSLYFIFSFLLIILYVILIYKIYDSWTRTEELKVEDDYVPNIFLTVVVAARNEAAFIASCVNSILANHYPQDLFELIVVDDHSEDNTLPELAKFNHPNLKVLNQREGVTGKKAALDLAFANVQAEVIVTTDADCLVPKNWLKNIAFNFENEHLNFAALPVGFLEGNNRLESFQILDLCGMMAITNYGILNQKFYLANGANMAFRRKAFIEVNGFDGNEQYASGDDMFLIHKMAMKSPDSVRFIKSKEAVVLTHPETSFSNLLQQRKRWATKSKAYSDRNLQLILAFVFIFNISIVFNLLLGPIFIGGLFFIGLLQLFVKAIMDYLFLYNMTKYFNRTDDMKSFFPASVISIGNVIYSGFVGIFAKEYSWKGRSQQ